MRSSPRAPALYPARGLRRHLTAGSAARDSHSPPAPRVPPRPRQAGGSRSPRPRPLGSPSQPLPGGSQRGGRCAQLARHMSLLERMSPLRRSPRPWPVPGAWPERFRLKGFPAPEQLSRWRADPSAREPPRAPGPSTLETGGCGQGVPALGASQDTHSSLELLHHLTHARLDGLLEA